MKRNLTILFLLGMLPWLACSEVIELRLDEEGGQVIIYGRITSGTLGNEIDIARVSPNGANQQPVEGAMVELLAENQRVGRYAEVSSGNYSLDVPDFSAVVGTNYHVRIQLANGAVYESLPARMPSAAATDFLDFESNTISIPRQNARDIRQNVVQFYMTTSISDPDSNPFLRWNLLETYLFPEQPQITDLVFPPPQWCYITEVLDEQEVFLYNGRELKRNEISRRLLYNRVADHAFVSEYYLQVVRSSLTADAYRFWNELDQVANVPGTIFDRPLAPVRSNIYNTEDASERVLGYFEVSNVDTTRLLVRADDIPFDIRRACPVVGFVEPECLDCLLLDNSAKVKPFFVD